MHAGRPRTRRLPDLRPANPGQLAVAGMALWLVGALAPGLAMLAALGAGMVAVAAVTYLLRPRRRVRYWRGRRVDLSGRPAPWTRLYRLLYRA